MYSERYRRGCIWPLHGNSLHVANLYPAKRNKSTSAVPDFSVNFRNRFCLDRENNLRFSRQILTSRPRRNCHVCVFFFFFFRPTYRRANYNFVPFFSRLSAGFPSDCVCARCVFCVVIANHAASKSIELSFASVRYDGGFLLNKQRRSGSSFVYRHVIRLLLFERAWENRQQCFFFFFL